MAFAFPACWADDERMNFLFQPFKDRVASNQTAYDRKLGFWKDLILQFLRFKARENSTESPNSILISVDDLSKEFTRKGRTPKCLDVVVQEMVKDDILVDVEVLKHDLKEKISRQQASWSSWGYQVMVSSPLRKLSGRLMAAVSPRTAKSNESRYVAKEMIEDIATSVLKTIRGSADSNFVGSSCKLVVTKCSVINMFPELPQELLNLALLWLESERFCIKTWSEDNQIYKFSENTNEAVEAISEVELGIVQIQSTKDMLNKRIDVWQKQCSQYLMEIKQQLVIKNKLNARRLLIRKKGLEKAIDKDIKHVQKLECVLDEIYTAGSNQMVVAAFESGSKTLKTLNESTSLKDVDEVMDQLSEQVALNQDISESLLSPISDESSVSPDADLEAELRDLLGETTSAEVDEGEERGLMAALDQLSIEDHQLPSSAEKKPSAAASLM